MHERFSVVCFVDQKVNRLVEGLRRKIPPRVAVMPAHVTVKGSFVEPVSIPEIQTCIERETVRTGSIELQVQRLFAGDRSMGLSLLPTAELMTLHNGLFYALEPLVKDVYGDRPNDQYRPHLTIFYGLSPEERKHAIDLLEPLERLQSVQLQDVNLMGRTGGAKDGTWEVIHTWPLGTQE